MRRRRRRRRRRRNSRRNSRQNPPTFYLLRGRLRLEVSLDSGRRVTQLRQLCLAAAKSMRTRGWWWRKCISRWRDGGADARTRA